MDKMIVIVHQQPQLQRLQLLLQFQHLHLRHRQQHVSAHMHLQLKSRLQQHLRLLLFHPQQQRLPQQQLQRHLLYHQQPPKLLQHKHQPQLKNRLLHKLQQQLNKSQLYHHQVRLLNHKLLAVVISSFLYQAMPHQRYHHASTTELEDIIENTGQTVRALHLLQLKLQLRLQQLNHQFQYLLQTKLHLQNNKTVVAKRNAMLKTLQTSTMTRTTTVTGYSTWTRWTLNVLSKTVSGHSMKLIALGIANTTAVVTATVEMKFLQATLHQVRNVLSLAKMLRILRPELE